jgi:nucleotidyltransferase/DNA polymerase involved in DNA repair
VIAKSYAMKAAGVKTGAPVWEALKKCPEAIYLNRDFRWYEVLSWAIHDTLRALSPELEYYSIDDFFFAASADPKCRPQEAVIAFRDQVSRAMGVPVTVGIGRSNTLAKVLSHSARLGPASRLNTSRQMRTAHRAGWNDGTTTGAIQCTTAWPTSGRQ